MESNRLVQRGADIREHAPECGQEVAEKARQIAVARVEREPGRGDTLRGDPSTDHGGLAETGRRRQEREGMAQNAVERAMQPGAVQRALAERRGVELGCEYRRLELHLSS